MDQAAIATRPRKRCMNFSRRIAEYRHRFQLGEDVAVEIRNLIKWLMNHQRGT